MASAPPLDNEPGPDSVTLENPELPLVEMLTLQPGQNIIVRGTVRTLEESGESRFNIDLCCGLLVNGDHRDNVAFHFNPRFDQAGGWFSSEPDTQIVINSLINNEWGKEDRFNNALTVGRSFTLHIRIFQNYFKIAVDDRHLCDFEYRIPLHMIRCIFIQGAVKIEEICFPKAVPTDD